MLDGDAVDGDTFGLQGGGSLRLYGADAPELNQRGWQRDMTPLAIGRQAKAIADGLVDPTGEIGTLRGYSFGRPVAPVMGAGGDVGQSLIRSGNALAAPDFMERTPQLATGYMEAERLARQNRLGVHGVYAQTPEQHRDNPGFLPERETVAMGWDTPTPFNGLRPEIERGYLGQLKTGTAAGILAYAAANRFTLDPADVAKYVKARDAGKGVELAVNYAPARPKPLTDLGDGAHGAAMRGFGDGVLPNLLDEVGAFPDSLGLTTGRENVWNSERRWADIYSNNIHQNRSILGYDDLEHPYARLTGQVAGGLAVPFGAGARTVPQLARVGAAYGGAFGFGGGETLPERLGGAVMHAGAGAVLTVAGGKLIQAGVKGYRALRGSGSAADDVAGETAAAAASRAPESPQATPDSVPPPPGYRRDPAAMDGEGMPSVSAPLRDRDYLDIGATRPRELLRDPSEAELRAATAGIEPRDVMPIRSNEIGSVEEAAAIDRGRIVEARAPNESTSLTRRTVRNWQGEPVPKVGPIDMVGFLRLRGGLKESGGELAHMGLENRARRDLDFVGQEARFGPLVNNETGSNLDDAAHSAWEAGYFPELAERPTVNQFLEALRDTYEGRQRRFLAEDFAEIEQHAAMRAERFDLERRRSEEDAPIFEDRSVPAGEPAPSAPIRAYEEWPDGGPDFAGNIRLGNLDSPQDIARALTTVNNRVGFDAATRGRVTQAETERLASELGMTPESLLARRKGQALNAEEALAARQILAKSSNELVNAAKGIQALEDPGDELLAEFRRKLARHVAIQEQVSGATAEAGRALSQFRMAANSRALRGDVLAGLVRGGGGRDRLKQAAEVLIEAAERGPGALNAMAAKATKPKFRDKLSELYINFLLSWPQTHFVNVVSNTLTSLAQIPEHAAAALIGRARQAVTKEALDRVTSSEVGARAFGLLQGAREGARLFTQAVKTGEPSDFVSKVEGQEYRAVSGLKGEILRVPTRMLQAEDEFFKGVARRMELNGEAVRVARKEGLKGEARQARIAELVANPTDEILERSMEYGRYLTFQRKLGPAGQAILNFANSHLAVKVFLPFVRTPTNLFKFAVERSPAAPLLREWRRDFVAGGERRDLAVARVLLGTGLGMAIFQGARDGLVTGSEPSDPKRARLLRADGWKPYSFKIGDTFYSYKRLDPFSTTIGVAADMATLPSGMSDRQRDDQAMLVVASIMGNLADKTFMQGVSSVVGALHEPDRNSGNLVQKLVGAFLVPNLVAGTARTIDPVQRKTDSVGEALQSRIPGLRDGLLPQRDVWGREVVNPGGVGPDWLSPIWASKQLNDPVNHELMQLDYAPGYPSKKVGGVELSPEQYDRYVAMSGKRSHRGLSVLVASPEWRAMDDEAKEKAASDLVTRARATARAELFGSSKASRKPNALPPPPPGFTVEGASGGRNVYADIQRAIPGVGFTSGYRTPEYQADMKRRGYRPADNSPHLDGSSLDLQPPPGKSMGWLKDRVRRFDPSSRMLNEGDHLHTTFPGYYGAPVLGGAKAAGLRNPLAGMPPPPAGFKLDAR